jgi:hypothetical protein
MKKKLEIGLAAVRHGAGRRQPQGGHIGPHHRRPCTLQLVSVATSRRGHPGLPSARRVEPGPPSPQRPAGIGAGTAVGRAGAGRGGGRRAARGPERMHAALRLPPAVADVRGAEDKFAVRNSDVKI